MVLHDADEAILKTERRQSGKWEGHSYALWLHKNWAATGENASAIPNGFMQCDYMERAGRNWLVTDRGTQVGILKGFDFKAIDTQKKYLFQVLGSDELLQFEVDYADGPHGVKPGTNLAWSRRGGPAIHTWHILREPDAKCMPPVRHRFGMGG